MSLLRLVDDDSRPYIPTSYIPGIYYFPVIHDIDNQVMCNGIILHGPRRLDFRLAA